MRTESNSFFQPSPAMKPHEHHHAHPSDTAGKTAPAAPSTRRGDAREPPSEEEVRRFGQLMERGRGAESKARTATQTVTADAVQGQHPRGGGGEGDLAQGGDDHEQGALPMLRHDVAWLPADAAAMQQAQLHAASAPAPATAAPAFGPALAELIEKHIRQMLVSENAGRGARGGEVLLRMSAAALPGTDLWLSRTERGWKLRADVRSRDSYQSILNGSPKLVQRFAERNLGELEIEPVYHGA